MELVRTRIPAYLWDSLQDVMYEHDYEFLKLVSKITHIPITELKHKILGTRGQIATVSVANTDSWWERELCPVRLRDQNGIWKQCGQYRQAHGYCHDHLKFEPSSTARRTDDGYFQTLKSRTPVQYDGEVVWVSSEGDAITELGEPVQGIRFDLSSRVMRQFASSSD
jgi:hypothetical protein